MERKTFLAVFSVFCLAFAGCENPTAAVSKTVAPELQGKWEISAMIEDGEERTYPRLREPAGGFLFTNNTVVDYDSTGYTKEYKNVYTDKTMIYVENEETVFFSITYGTLKILDADKAIGTIAQKVTKFSWE